GRWEVTGFADAGAGPRRSGDRRKGAPRARPGDGRTRELRTPHPRRVDGLEIREVDDGFMVHDARESPVPYLKRPAVVVLELCDGQRAVADIAKRVAKAFGLPAPPRREVDEILARMTAQGLVVRRPARRRGRGGPAAEKLRRFPHLLWINL